MTVDQQARPRDTAVRAVPAADDPPEPPDPRLVIHLARVTAAYRAFATAFPGVAVHYAVTRNPDPALLAHLRDLGSGFEIASGAELRILATLGIAPADVLFSHPVKPWWHVRDTYAAGVRRFAADSDGELAKIARHAPGSSVHVRLSTAGPGPVAGEGKFGASADEAYRLVHAAVRLGLRPWALAFHVGSQTVNPRAWDRPIAAAAAVMRRLSADGIRLAAIDIGGGFPARHPGPVPSVAEFGRQITGSLRRQLPYEVGVVAEPGRGLVADAGVLEATVIGVAVRGGQRWAYLDIGTSAARHSPMSCERGGPTARWHVTGPGADSRDTLQDDVPLPAALAAGDRVRLHSAGADPTAYAHAVSGFPILTTVRVDDLA